MPEPQLMHNRVLVQYCVLKCFLQFIVWFIMEESQHRWYLAYISALGKSIFLVAVLSNFESLVILVLKMHFCIIWVVLLLGIGKRSLSCMLREMHEFVDLMFLVKF